MKRIKRWICWWIGHGEETSVALGYFKTCKRCGRIRMWHEPKDEL